MSLAIAFVWAVGSVICHQRPDRSFFVAGHQLPVCARCSGLYLSAAIGAAAWLVMRWRAGARPFAITSASALRVVAIAAVPTLVSWTAGVLGVWDGSNLARAALAVPLGATAGAVVAAVATKDLR